MFFKSSITTSGNLETFNMKIERDLLEHRRKYFLQGVLFIVAGLLAAAFPATTAFNVEFIIGVILLLTGILQLILTLKSKRHGWALLSATLSIATGLLLLWQPLPMLMAYVTVLAVFMTIEGILEILLSFRFRPALNWDWMFLSGIVTLVLATVLWIGSPIFDALYLGWIIAFNLVLYGLSLLMLVGKAPAIQSDESKKPSGV